jgi:hypothetical protein
VAIPTTEHFHGSWFGLHPVEYLEVFHYDKSPDSRALSDFWVTLWKETKAFTGLNDHFAQLARG